LFDYRENESIDCLIDELKKHEFKLKDEKNVNEYLSCCIEESKDEAKLTMIQPHLLTCLIQNFGEEIEGKRKFLTLGRPRFKIQRSTTNMDVLDPQSQRKYRSGVGMLLYLTKYSRPDISNIVQELSKCMDSATWGAYNELLRVIKLVIDTRTFGFKVQPKLDNNLGWYLKIFCDSNREGDPETRVSVTGFIIYLLNVPICWRSKPQKGVTLLGTEAEYVIISKAVKVLKFIYYLLSDLHIKVNLLIVVKRTLLEQFLCPKMLQPAFVLGTWIPLYHFVQEFIEDGFTKIKFVHSVENDSDLFTKNVNQELYAKHTKKFLEDSGVHSTG
jgi:hypothetical protein